MSEETHEPPVSQSPPTAPPPPVEQHAADGPPPGVLVMEWVRWLLIAVMAGIAALSVAYSFGLFAVDSASAAATQYYCPMHPQIVQDRPGECPICSMSLVLKETGATPAAKPSSKPAASAADHAGHRHEPSDPYFCPMHPNETGLDEKARCPICGMKLDKRVAPQGAVASPPSGVPGLVPVMLSLERTQLIGVRTAKVEAGQLARELRAVGFVAADEARMARVSTRFAGWVERLAVRTTGEKVRPGQVLAGIFNLELLPAQQEFLAARRWSGAGGAPGAGPSGSAQLGAGMEQDARARLQLFGMSPGEIDSIAKSGKPARTIAITSPTGGYVVRKNVVQGDYVQPGSELFEIADLSTVWVLADVYEQDMARLATGQAATVAVAAYPAAPFAGKVGFISPVVDATSRTLRVRIELDNREQKLRPGMFADVVLQLGDSQAVVVIPTEALVDTGDHKYVFVAKEGGLFEPRRVKAGARSGEKVQIFEGLVVGEVVVTTANFLIDSESRLRAAVQGSASVGQE